MIGSGVLWENLTTWKGSVMKYAPSKIGFPYEGERCRNLNSGIKIPFCFFFLTLHDLPISGQGCSAQERPHGMWIDLPRDEVIGDRKGFQK